MHHVPCYHSGALDKGFRSFHRGNIGSVDQKASKVLAVNLEVSTATLAITAKVCASVLAQNLVGLG